MATCRCTNRGHDHHVGRSCDQPSAASDNYCEACRQAAAAKGLKPYSKPHLVTHGHVRDIVQGGGGHKNDPSTHNSTKV
jgi:hypothetical protein